MENSKRKLSKGLKRLFIVTILVAVLYIAAFIVYAFMVKDAGDADLANIGAVMKYHLDGVLKLFLFQYASTSSVIVNYALSAFLYGLIVCWLIFLVAGIMINDRKDRKVMWWGIIFTFVNLLVYLVFASGCQKFWQMVNQRVVIAGKGPLLMILVLAVLGLGAIFFLLALLCYLFSIIDSYFKPGPEAEKDEEKAAPSDVDIRAIVRDELIKNQPFQVVVVGGELQMAMEEQEEPEPEPEPVKEEPKPEPIPEPVKEEPKVEEKRVWPTVNFWEVAREVFPAFDNPKPLPKEEKVVEPQPQEDNDEWNRNKRQPFLNRIITADLDIKANYNEIKNEILSYGVKARLSRSGETFRLKEKKYVKIYLVGKTLKVYFALPPEDYKDSTFPIEDVGHRPNYAEMPLLFKVRSGLSVRRCKELVKATMERDGLTKNDVQDVNWVNELRAQNAEKAKENKK